MGRDAQRRAGSDGQPPAGRRLRCRRGARVARSECRAAERRPRRLRASPKRSCFHARPRLVESTGMENRRRAEESFGIAGWSEPTKTFGHRWPRRTPHTPCEAQRAGSKCIWRGSSPHAEGWGVPSPHQVTVLSSAASAIAIVAVRCPSVAGEKTALYRFRQIAYLWDRVESLVAPGDDASLVVCAFATREKSRLRSAATESSLHFADATAESILTDGE